MPQSALRQTVRERLANGWLFPAPHKVWVGKGTRQICIVCGTAIGPSEVENEVLGSTTVWSHLPCDSIWREESEPHVRAGGRWSGLTTSLVCARPCVSGSRMGRYSCCRTTSHGLGEAWVTFAPCARRRSSRLSRRKKSSARHALTHIYWCATERGSLSQ